MGKYIVTGIILGGLIILAFEFWPAKKEVVPEKTVETSSEEAPPAVTEPPVTDEPEKLDVQPRAEAQPTPELPGYDESDSWLDDELGDALLALPKSDRIARGVTLVLTASNGVLNRKNWPAIGKFPVLQEGERIFLDPIGFDRYEPWI